MRRVIPALAVAALALSLSVTACGGEQASDGSPSQSSPALTRAWAVGTLILATEDGGVHWRPQAMGVDASLGDVAFCDELRGWAVGEGSENEAVVLFTTDGGATWVGQGTRREEDLTDVACSDRLHAWATTWGGGILATSDGGNTWLAQRTGWYLGSSLMSVACADAEHVWAVGGRGLILATTDGGATWVEQRRSARGDLLDDVCFVDPQRGWAVGLLDDRDAILATVDGGATWTSQTPGTTTELFGIAASDAAHAWAVGGDGTILATSDGGLTWSARESGTDADLYSVSFADSRRGWALGVKAIGDPEAPGVRRVRTVILSTSDGGATWITQYSRVGRRFGHAICAAPAP
jgi:photosystem II stability/assembly factor-like uncharacterized protein